MNEQFLARMQALLKEDYPAFLASLDAPLSKGARINRKKTTPAMETELQPYLNQLEPAPFARDLYFTDGQPGLLPYWHTGTLYSQEPSAAAPVDILEVQPDDWVLDLCAAPGSKSTQIARNLETGLLLSNEYDPARARILLSNLERNGYANTVITNMDTGDLCSQLEGCFDKVLVDAPCSGEGMMKKHEAAVTQWSEQNIQHCAILQKQILDNAVKALKPGGTLVYSTCTYAPEENEDQVKAFLADHPDMELEPIEKPYGRPGLEGIGLRIFPMDGGEGQFACKFKKQGTEAKRTPRTKKAEKPDKTETAFLKDILKDGERTFAQYCHHNGVLYGMDQPFLDLKGKVLRQGIAIGETRKGRFEPAHALFLSEAMLDTDKKTELDLEQLDRYLHGEQLQIPAPKGYRAVCWNGVPAGFAKSTGSALNNKFPKGLRLLPNSHLKGSHET